MQNFAVTRKGAIVPVNEQNERLLSERATRVSQIVAACLLTLFLGLAVLLATGLMPPTPWSPVGKYQQHQEHRPPASPVAPAPASDSRDA